MLSSYFKKYSPQTHEIENTLAYPIEITVEIYPLRYVLKPGEKMRITSKAQNSDFGLSISLYDKGVQIYAGEDIEPSVTIDGKYAAVDWVTEI